MTGSSLRRSARTGFIFLTFFIFIFFVSSRNELAGAFPTLQERDYTLTEEPTDYLSGLSEDNNLGESSRTADVHTVNEDGGSAERVHKHRETNVEKADNGTKTAEHTSLIQNTPTQLPVNEERTEPSKDGDITENKKCQECQAHSIPPTGSSSSTATPQELPTSTSPPSSSSYTFKPDSRLRPRTPTVSLPLSSSIPLHHIGQTSFSSSSSPPVTPISPPHSTNPTQPSHNQGPLTATPTPSSRILNLLTNPTQPPHSQDPPTATSTSSHAPSPRSFPRFPSRRQGFGSHPIPSQGWFRRRDDNQWSAYFHDQAVAMVHHGHDGTVTNCTVLEVIEEWEQQEALQYLGAVMPLRPVSLTHMVHIISLCGALNTPPPTQPSPTPQTSQQGNNDDWWVGSSALVGILPGTLWCGRRDQARSYHQLGPRARLDSCCRTHDHCPVKLVPLATRYSIANLGFTTKSHCLCETELYRCLKSVEDPLAKIIGDLYFNILKMDCLGNPPSPTHAPARPRPTHTQRIEDRCSKRDSKGECRMWLVDSESSVRYVFRPTNLTF